MAKVDLHCHSKYSDKPSTWFLKAYNSPESFTEPEALYEQAKGRGMDLVTITDHDDIRGCLELQKNHPEDTFVSCEVTSWFPEDDCKVHILVYGIDRSQYRKLMELRQDLYLLRDYIVKEHIAYSVAHATYDQDGKLAFSHIEKLVLLFDVFEVVNGGASKQNNVILQRYLQSLDESAINKLRTKHAIQPISIDPWIKGFTGGSDDHCGILIGSAYSESISNTTDKFLQSLRDKNTLAHGQHGGFEIYATGVIKHIHDYRSQRDSKYSKSKMNDFLEMFFSGHEGNWVKRFKKSRSLSYLKRKNGRIYGALHNLLYELDADISSDIVEKIPHAYQQIVNLHDEMFRSSIKALAKNLPEGNLFKTFDHLSNLFPMLVLAAPFVGSMRHQILKGALKKPLTKACKGNYEQKTLWFTDTIDDLNGVSVSLRQIAHQSQSLGYRITLVTCVNEETIRTPLPANTLNLTPVYQHSIPGYEQQQLGFPSLLGMMQKIILEQPDQIIISTPGPVGLGALLCAKLMDMPVKTIYHTDFAEQVLRITNEPVVANMVEYLTKSFYKQADQVYVPSLSYIKKLSETGIENDSMHLFPRGLDTQLYSPSSSCKPIKNNLSGEFTLLYAGRVSEDKNLSLLASIMEHANATYPGRYNLVIAGDGPFLSQLKQRLKTQHNVCFTGRIESDEMVSWYQSADLLVFPSHTDTFGMVVLEAQACGTPCLVTASGGPKEIILNNETGQVIFTDDAIDWFSVIQSYFRMRSARPLEYANMLDTCRARVLKNNCWHNVFESVLGDEYKPIRNPDTPIQSDSPSGPNGPISPNNTHSLAA